MPATTAKGQLIPDTYTSDHRGSGIYEGRIRINCRSEWMRRSVSTRRCKVGDVTTQVEVAASAPLLQSDRADVAQTFTSKEINDLPNIGRNLQSMELLQPGTAKLGWQHASDENPQGSVQMVVNGQLSRPWVTNWTARRTRTRSWASSSSTRPSTQCPRSSSRSRTSMRNFPMWAAALLHTPPNPAPTTSTAMPSSTCSSTLQDLRRLPANPFYGLPAATYRQNQFGGSIGGPIIKDKLFFFGDAQLNRQSQGASLVTSVPTALNRAGNFSDWLSNNSNYQIYDPSTGDPTTGVGALALREQHDSGEPDHFAGEGDAGVLPSS